MADTSGPTLKPTIYEFVEKGSRIMTDEWSAYNGLSKDYDHKYVGHGKKVYSVGEVSRKTIEVSHHTDRNNYMGSVCSKYKNGRVRSTQPFSFKV